MTALFASPSTGGEATASFSAPSASHPTTWLRLARGWTMDRLDRTMKAILRAGAYELIARGDVPVGAVVSEYVDVAKAFFDAREAHARGLGGFKWCAFAAVERQADDPRRPPGHRGNDAFWHKRGYRRSDIAMQLPWNETGRGETGHTLGFWLRPLEEIA